MFKSSDRILLNIRNTTFMLLLLQICNSNSIFRYLQLCTLFDTKECIDRTVKLS